MALSINADSQDPESFRNHGNTINDQLMTICNTGRCLVVASYDNNIILCFNIVQILEHATLEYCRLEGSHW